MGAIIFDFDMTLVDSLEIGNKSFRELEEEYGLNLGGMTQKEMWSQTHIGLMRKLAEFNDGKYTNQKGCG